MLVPWRISDHGSLITPHLRTRGVSLLIRAHPWFQTRTQQIIRLRWNFALPIVIAHAIRAHLCPSVVSNTNAAINPAQVELRPPSRSTPSPSIPTIRGHLCPSVVPNTNAAINPAQVELRPPSRFTPTQSIHPIRGHLCPSVVPSTNAANNPAQVELRPPYRFTPSQSIHARLVAHQDAAQGGAAVVRVGRVRRPFSNAPSQVWRTRAS